jgi:hypothetical protein
VGVLAITANTQGCRDVVNEVVLDELADIIEELIRVPMRLVEIKQVAIGRCSSFDL